MVATTKELEGFFRPNRSLERTIFSACRDEGFGFFQAWGASSRVRRMKPDARKELETQLGLMVQDAVGAGTLKLPTKTEIAGGVVVTGWQDLFAWFMENLPAILEMISKIIDMFN